MAEIIHAGSQDAQGNKNTVKLQRPGSAPVLPNNLNKPYNKKRTDLIYGYSGPGFNIMPPQSKDDNYRFAAMARVAENRQIKEAQFWGRSVPEKRDLPAFWSLGSHGQPYNDKRLWYGQSILYHTIANPRGVQVEARNPSGPLMERGFCIRQSITTGKNLVKPDLSPILFNQDEDKKIDPQDLTIEQRHYLIGKLQPQQRIIALSLNLDQDTKSDTFRPWTVNLLAPLDRQAWFRDKGQCIRLATEQLEVMMFRHLLYLSKVEYQLAQAPYQRQKDVLIRAFWAVDPEKTGQISMEQFMQVWQNILQLWDYEVEESEIGYGRFVKKKQTLVPTRRRILDIHMAAAIFQKYGYDRNGFMPYVVFVNALTEAPNRLLGHEGLLNLKFSDQNGFRSQFDIAHAMQNAKIIYPKCKSGVFAPSGFDPRQAYRSNFLPRAHMWLENVYGYAGVDNLSSNLFYTKNTSNEVTELVYYVGAVGIVYYKEKHEKQKPSQKYFFGHDNDIQCLAVHPSRKYVATGQQLSYLGVPYVCVWEVNNCCMLQKLDHAKEDRSVIACAFSGHIDCKDERKVGGDILLTVTSDDRHTIHIWLWMTERNKYIKAQYIPGWFYGPDYKLRDLESQNFFYQSGSYRYKQRKHDEYNFSLLRSGTSKLQLKNPMYDQTRDLPVDPQHARGFHTLHQPTFNDGTWLKLGEYIGCQGTPPCVYGISWNPYKPQDGNRGSEFLTYGTRHLRTWMARDKYQFQGTQAHFGVRNIENVYCACFIPAQHHRCAPGDSCIASGFANGDVGIWIPPYPTRAGSAYRLQRIFNAHSPGKTVVLNDGTQKPIGVRCIKLLEDQTKLKRKEQQNILATAGSDGQIHFWTLIPPRSKLRENGTRRLGLTNPDMPLQMYVLKIQKTVQRNEYYPNIKSLDVNPAKITDMLIPDNSIEFVAGTDTCCIWENKGGIPKVLINGHHDDVYCLDPHPVDPNHFVTVSKSKDVKIWNAPEMQLTKAASVGFEASCCAYSQEPLTKNSIPGWIPNETGDGYHVAVGGFKGKVLIVDSGNLQPLVRFSHSKHQISCLAYSKSNPDQILAVGSHDLNIYIHNATRSYEFVSKLVGHSGTILSLDWSLPLNSPIQLAGKLVLQSNSMAYEILYWEPFSGRKVVANQRNTNWNTWTCTLGFPVMGIWEQYMDNTWINSVHRSNRGRPGHDRTLMKKTITQDLLGLSINYTASAEDSSDMVPGCCYLVSADDEQFVKLFNYPVLSDQAPYRCYRGHASHVMCVRFLADDRHVVSVGGKDRSVFQWRTCRINKEDEFKDEQLLIDLEKIIQEKAQVLDSLAPQPNGQWGPIDEDGVWYGPHMDPTLVNVLKEVQYGNSLKVKKSVLINSIIHETLQRVPQPQREEAFQNLTSSFRRVGGGEDQEAIQEYMQTQELQQRNLERQMTPYHQAALMRAFQTEKRFPDEGTARSQISVQKEEIQQQKPVPEKPVVQTMEQIKSIRAQQSAPITQKQEVVQSKPDSRQIMAVAESKKASLNTDEIIKSTRDQILQNLNTQQRPKSARKVVMSEEQQLKQLDKEEPALIVKTEQTIQQALPSVQGQKIQISPKQDKKLDRQFQIEGLVRESQIDKKEADKKEVDEKNESKPKKSMMEKAMHFLHLDHLHSDKSKSEKANTEISISEIDVQPSGISIEGQKSHIEERDRPESARKQIEKEEKARHKREEQEEKQRKKDEEKEFERLQKEARMLQKEHDKAEKERQKDLEKEQKEQHRQQLLQEKEAKEKQKQEEKMEKERQKEQEKLDKEQEKQREKEEKQKKKELEKQLKELRKKHEEEEKQKTPKESVIGNVRHFFHMDDNKSNKSKSQGGPQSVGGLDNEQEGSEISQGDMSLPASPSEVQKKKGFLGKLKVLGEKMHIGGRSDKSGKSSKNVAQSDVQSLGDVSTVSKSKTEKSKGGETVDDDEDQNYSESFDLGALSVGTSIAQSKK